MKTSPRLVLAASLLFAIVLPAIGGPTASTGKNPKNPKAPEPLPPLPPPPLLVNAPPANRIGVLATGGFGIDAKFLTEAYIKKDPKAPVTALEGTESDDFSPGFEVFYERVLSDTRNRAQWGVRVGAGYTNIEADEEFTVPSTKVGLETELDADLIHVNVGPFYEYRFTDRFYGQLGAGLTAAYINADLSTRDSTGLFNADADEDDFLFGAYASAAVGYDLTPRTSLMAGVRYQYLEDFEIDNGSTDAELDFDSAFLAFVGLRFSF